MTSHKLIVTRENLDLHPIAMQSLQYLGHILLWRISEGQEPHEDEVVLISRVVALLFWHLAVGNGKEAKSLCAQTLVQCFIPGSGLGIKWVTLPV
jgi:hypothetical protein